MRSERSCFVLWTRRAILTKEEIKQMKEERAAAVKQVPGIGDVQRFFLRSELMAAHRTGFVNRVMAALRGAELAATELSAKDALILARGGVDPTGLLSCDMTQRDELEWRGYAGAIGPP